MKWKFALVAYCCLVLYGSSLSPSELPEKASLFSDKFLHFAEYAVMGLLAWGGFGRVASGFPWALFAFCICFGIGDECWQDWLGNARNPDVWDAAVDAAGSFCGLLLAMVFWRK